MRGRERSVGIMPISPPERAAAGILAVEAVAILALAGWEIVALVSGDTEAVVSSIALIVLTVIGAAAVDMADWGTWEAASFALLLWMAVNVADVTARKRDPHN